MSTAKIILNPYANHWRARERLPEVERILRETGFAYELVQTEAPGHGIELAAQAVREGFSPIIAAGGDSTINEVVNGMMQVWAERQQADQTPQVGESPQVAPPPQAEPTPQVSLTPEDSPPPADDLPPLGVIPLGTANDLVANLGLPNTLQEAIIIVRDGKTRRIDVGQCNQRYFINNAGIGLEPYATYKHIQIPDSKRSTWRYIQAALQAIAKNPSWEMDIFWDEGRYHGPVSLVTIGNGARTGGTFFITPEADPFDGLLDFGIAYFKGRLSALRHMIIITRPHNALPQSPKVHLGRSKSLYVNSKTPTFLHTDGELFQEQTKMRFRIYSAALSILT